MRTPEGFLYSLAPETGVATITLNRPDTLNSLTFAIYRELTDFFAALDHERDVRAVVLTGTGRAFCSGGDVEDIIGELFARDMQGLLEFTRVTGALIRNMRALRKPLVAAVNGTCVGAGAVMALAADFRVAADTAKFGFIFPKVGLSGADMGAAYLLPRVIGLARATELLMLGEFVEPAEALRLGLYHRVVPRERLEAETAALVDRLVRGPREALAATKESLNRELHLDLDQALDLEARVQAGLMLRPDFHEGFRAFRERRAPRFAGAPE